MTREQELKRLNAWLAAHPVWGWGLAIWFALAVLTAAEGLRWAMDSLAKRF